MFDIPKDKPRVLFPLRDCLAERFPNCTLCLPDQLADALRSLPQMCEVQEVLPLFAGQPKDISPALNATQRWVAYPAFYLAQSRLSGLRLTRKLS